MAKKTGRQRTVPVEPKLYQLLLDAFDQAEEGQQRVAPISKHCLCRNFQIIRERAAPPQWKDAFKVMGNDGGTDCAQVYPQYAVSVWIGHGIQVFGCHYLQVPEVPYEKVAATNAAEIATKSHIRPAPLKVRP